jgi:membrane-bound inhibitor of C-type lysozyme
MRVAIISFIVLSVLITGCKKNNAQQAQQAVQQAQTQAVTKSNDPVITQMNTIIAPLTPEAAESLNRVFAETTYTCAGNSKFKVRFKQSEAEIDVGWGKTATLSKQAEASGFWYRNDQYDLRGKGSDAILAIQGHKPIACTSGKAKK